MYLVQFIASSTRYCSPAASRRPRGVTPAHLGGRRAAGRMHRNAFRGRRGREVPVERDEIEPGTHGELQVRRVIDGQPAPVGKRAERSDIRQGMVGAQEKLSGVIEYFQPLL